MSLCSAHILPSHSSELLPDPRTSLPLPHNCPALLQQFLELWSISCLEGTSGAAAPSEAAEDGGAVPEWRPGTAGRIPSCCRQAEIVGTAAAAPTWLAGACMGVMERGSGSEGTHTAASQDSAWFHSHSADSRHRDAVTSWEHTSLLCLSRWQEPAVGLSLLPPHAI